jgi:hypothetical protein
VHRTLCSTAQNRVMRSLDDVQRRTLDTPAYSYRVCPGNPHASRALLELGGPLLDASTCCAIVFCS